MRLSFITMPHGGRLIALLALSACQPTPPSDAGAAGSGTRHRHRWCSDPTRPDARARGRQRRGAGHDYAGWRSIRLPPRVAGQRRGRRGGGDGMAVRCISSALPAGAAGWLTDGKPACLARRRRPTRGGRTSRGARDRCVTPEYDMGCGAQMIGVRKRAVLAGCRQNNAPA